MIHTSSQRYLTPKWQARVIPASAAFKFSNGVTVHNLWELKQALTVVREDIINEYIQKENHIAIWVKNVVGDAELADKFQSCHNRWQMIVALEQHMMQTLSLPYYVASRWLQTSKWPFTFVSGQQADSLESLLSTIYKLEDEDIVFHLQRNPNDIAKWVNDIIGDYLLADILQEAENKKQLIDFLENHIKMLQNAISCK